MLRDILAEEIEMIWGDMTIPQDAMLESMLNQNDALEEMDYTICELWHDDGTYIAHLDLEGVFSNPYRFRLTPDEEERAVEPTGEEVSGSAVHLLRFDDSGNLTAANSYGYTDMMREMGVLSFAGDEDEEALAEAAE